MSYLDAASSPAATAGGDSPGVSDSIASNSVATASRTVHNPETKSSRSKPEDGAQEAESDISLPLLARALVGQVAPVEDAAAVERANEGDEQAEGDEPEDGDQEIDWPVQEGAAEWEQPDEGEEHGEGCDGFGVDEAALGQGVVGHVLVGMKPFACEASDDGCKGELADAEQHAEERISEWCHCE